MIYIKSQDEIKKLRKCGIILASLFEHLEPYIQEGITTSELDSIAESYILSKGCIPVQKGYSGFPATLCVSVNEEVIHGIPGKKKLKKGDLVGIDCTISKDNLMTDSARTFPVGKISPDDQKLLERTAKALDVGISVSKHNMRISDIGKAIEEYLKPYNYGIVRDYCGHGVGYNIHEEPTILHYYSRRYNNRLKEGTVFTIEPMINAGTHEVDVLDDGWTVVSADASNSCHFEHTLCLTKTGCEVLTLE